MLSTLFLLAAAVLFIASLTFAMSGAGFLSSFFMKFTVSSTNSGSSSNALTAVSRGKAVFNAQAALPPCFRILTFSF
uniref:Putative secreted protein n=1 Tax=Ixodes ricinus TaxID=34613 RepID=A0A6B0U4S3_IXORI